MTFASVLTLVKLVLRCSPMAAFSIALFCWLHVIAGWTGDFLVIETPIVADAMRM